MSFQELVHRTNGLRTSLNAFVDQKALAEINVAPPISSEGELNFLRLIVWSYALCFEAGRVAIPFLYQVPSATGAGNSNSCRQTRKNIGALRTWAFHNLTADSDRDAATIRSAELWLISANGSRPRDDLAWGICFQQLCAQVLAIVDQCHSSLDMLISEQTDDRNSPLKELKHQVSRNWAAHDFDQMLNEAAFRLELRSLNLREMRDQLITKWREYVLTLDCDLEEAKRSVSRLMEQQLLERTQRVLPIGTQDIIEALGVNSGLELRRYLLIAQYLYDGGITNKDALIESTQALVQRSISG